MSDAWDDEDVEVKESGPKNAIGETQWVGEDDDEDIKESWEDFDVDDDKAKNSMRNADKLKKKRNLKEIIAEKEEKMRIAAEERKKQMIANAEPQTAEDIYAEKLRQQKIQEDADLELAKETFGYTNNSLKCGVESMQPSNKEEFDTFKKDLVEIISKHEKSSFYGMFLEDFMRDLSLNLEADDIKKLGNSLLVLANEKIKVSKSGKGKKKGGKGKASLVVGKSSDDYAFDGGNEYDDFI